MMETAVRWLKVFSPTTLKARCGNFWNMREIGWQDRVSLIVRFAHSKVVEIWNHRDDLGMREQSGAPIYAGSHRTE